MKNPIPTEYIQLTESLKNVSKFVVINFDDSELNVKQIIIRNFIAKSHSLLQSIFLLLQEDQEGEAIALYRLLIERYFYLEYLHRTNLYQEFKDWSYIKTFESRNKMRSNSSFNDKHTKKLLIDDKEQVKKYKELKANSNLWIEPKLENLAKEIDLSFLYSMGYDLGSSFIHPRADEGYWDALRIVKKQFPDEHKRNNTLKNTILMSNAILIFGANNSGVDFGKFLNYYCNSIFEFLGGNSEFPNLKNLENLFYSSVINSKNHG